MFYKITQQLLTQIKNACVVNKSKITINYCSNTGLLLYSLKKEGFIRGSKLIIKNKKLQAIVYLKFNKRLNPAISSAKNIGKTMHAKPVTTENVNLLYRNFNFIVLNGINKTTKTENIKLIALKNNQSIYLLK
jgi:ribosomal protein S8